jgi:hypothetical protein
MFSAYVTGDCNTAKEDDRCLTDSDWCIEKRKIGHHVPETPHPNISLHIIKKPHTKFHMANMPNRSV